MSVSTPEPKPIVDEAIAALLADTVSVVSLYINHPSYTQAVWFVNSNAQYAWYTTLGSAFLLYDYALGGNLVSLDLTRASFATPLTAKAISKSGDPTGSDISGGYWAVVKNTSNGEIRLWYNDSGTLKKTAVLS